MHFHTRLRATRVAAMPSTRSTPTPTSRKGTSAKRRSPDRSARTVMTRSAGATPMQATLATRTINSRTRLRRSRRRHLAFAPMIVDGLISALCRTSRSKPARQTSPLSAFDAGYDRATGPQWHASGIRRRCATRGSVFLPLDVPLRDLAGTLRFRRRHVERRRCERRCGQHSGGDRRRHTTARRRAIRGRCDASKRTSSTCAGSSVFLPHRYPAHGRHRGIRPRRRSFLAACTTMRGVFQAPGTATYQESRICRRRR